MAWFNFPSAYISAGWLGLIIPVHTLEGRVAGFNYPSAYISAGWLGLIIPVHTLAPDGLV